MASSGHCAGRGHQFTFQWKNARLLRTLPARKAGEYITTHDVSCSTWAFVPIIVFLCKRLQYSGRMTNKDLPNELLKIKGREPLPQNFPNHVNNMASRTHSEPSFKSKSQVSYPSSSAMFFRMLSLRAFCHKSQVLSGNIRCVVKNMSKSIYHVKTIVLIAIVFHCKVCSI